MEILLDFAWLVGLLVLIVVACGVFTNGVEWVGHCHKLSDGAVGSVLAAVGTALPETLVPIVALLAGGMAGSGISKSAGEEIGIGAILGAPFLLGTLAMFIAGLAVVVFAKVLKTRPFELKLDKHLFLRDIQYFLAAYVLVFVAAFIPSLPVKIAIAIGLLIFYGIYVYRTFRKEHIPDAEFHLEPLYFSPRRDNPALLVIYAQLFVGLVGIIVLAHEFVERISMLSGSLGIEALILSLIIVPIATEMPEKFNSVTWLGKRKDNLALGNITGAMVFQSCIPTSVGLIFTPWHLTFQAGLSVGLCLLSVILIYAWVFYQKSVNALPFLLGGIFYVIFVGYNLVRLL